MRCVTQFALSFFLACAALAGSPRPEGEPARPLEARSEDPCERATKLLPPGWQCLASIEIEHDIPEGFSSAGRVSRATWPTDTGRVTDLCFQLAVGKTPDGLKMALASVAGVVPVENGVLRARRHRVFVFDANGDELPLDTSDREISSGVSARSLVGEEPVFAWLQGMTAVPLTAPDETRRARLVVLAELTHARQSDYADFVREQAGEKAMGLPTLPRVGRPLHFNLKDIDGEHVATSIFRGRPVVVLVWGTGIVSSGHEDSWPDTTTLLARVPDAQIVHLMLDGRGQRGVLRLKLLEKGVAGHIVPMRQIASRELWREVSDILSPGRVLVLDREGVLRHDGMGFQNLADTVADALSEAKQAPATPPADPPRRSPPADHPAASRRAL